MATVRLVLVEGEALPSQVTVDGPLDLGRDPHCDLRLLGDRASRFHARVEPAGDGISLSDNRSRNGTLVDGQPIERVRLGDGRRFTLAGATFVVLVEEADAPVTRVVADGGLQLDAAQERAARPWVDGDDPRELELVHATTRRLAAAAPGRDRARGLATIAAKAVAATRAAVVTGGTVLGGDCSPRLAGRLASGDRARLLVLGRELQGHTIATEAVGSALSAPLGGDAWLVAVRGLDAEAFDDTALGRFARLAAEAAPYFPASDLDPLAPLVGASEAMVALRRRLRRLAAAEATVLVTGASGTGKELVARCLHEASGRRSGPFVPVNCAAVAPGLFEAELFGHEKGAFTGADQARTGRIRAADGGTLFLDEVGELPTELQAKLLRVLQEGQVEPVGSAMPQVVDVRVVAATNRDLAAAVLSGDFREDLFYRLDVLRVHTPSLDERRSDIPLLARHLVARFAEAEGRPAPALGAGALERLQAAAWPGNVRQLGNALERALVLADDTITPEHLELAPARAPAPASDDGAGGFPSLAEVEARHVAAALGRSGWNKSAAARLLGVSRPTILRKIAEYGLEPPA